MTIDVGSLEGVDPRLIWSDEARNFTPWLAQNIDRLGKALGLDLELLQTESRVGGFSCDIHARDTGRDRPVIIENQLGATDHDHLGKLLTYAAGLDAAVIVWIGTRFREEHRQTLDWLNHHTDDRIEFFGINLEVVRIDQSRPAVQFRLVAFPNAWSKPRSAERDVSGRGALYAQFYQPLFDELRETHRFTNARVAQSQNWYSFASGVGGVSYHVAFANRSRLRVGLYIDLGEIAATKAMFDVLKADRANIETLLEERLDWERLDGFRACRISVIRPDTTIESAIADGDSVRRWMVDRLLKIKRVFSPRLESAREQANVPALANDLPVDG